MICGGEKSPPLQKMEALTWRDKVEVRAELYL